MKKKRLLQFLFLFSVTAWSSLWFLRLFAGTLHLMMISGFYSRTTSKCHHSTTCGSSTLSCNTITIPTSSFPSSAQLLSTRRGWWRLWRSGRVGMPPISSAMCIPIRLTCTNCHAAGALCSCPRSGASFISTWACGSPRTPSRTSSRSPSHERTDGRSVSSLFFTENLCTWLSGSIYYMKSSISTSRIWLVPCDLNGPKKTFFLKEFKSTKDYLKHKGPVLKAKFLQVR